MDHEQEFIYCFSSLIHKVSRLVLMNFFTNKKFYPWVNNVLFQNFYSIQYPSLVTVISIKFHSPLCSGNKNLNILIKFFLSDLS